MKDVRSGLLATLLGLAAVSSASAMPIPAIAPPDPLIHKVVQGYGPQRYGVYTHFHRRHRHLSYGVGYNKRGSRTGGPAGGNPSRN